MNCAEIWQGSIIRSRKSGAGGEGGRLGAALISPITRFLSHAPRLLPNHRNSQVWIFQTNKHPSCVMKSPTLLHARLSCSPGNPASCELRPSSHNVWRDQAEKKGPAIKGDTASKEQQLHYGGMEAPSHAHPDPRLNNYQKVTK